MKIRNGFVSNSSSSSFIIAKCYIGEEKFKKLIYELDKLENSTEIEFGSWGDNDRTFSQNGEYLIIETYYVYDKISEIFKKLDISEKNGFYID